MKVPEWERLQVDVTMRGIMMEYIRLKPAFLNPKKVEEYSDDPNTIAALERLQKRLEKLKLKLETYKKSL